MVIGAVVAVLVTLVVSWLALVALLWHARPEERSARALLRLLPDVVRLVRRIAGDEAVGRGVRARLWLLLAYLAFPIDLVPDFVPVIGYADDVVIVALVLRSVVRRAGPEAVRRHWPGTPQGLETLWRAARLPAPIASPYAPPVRTRGGAMGRLDGKVALITGGASGMGMVASKLFAAEGASVMLSDVADQAGEALAAEIRADGGKSAFVHADVSSEADAEAMVAAAVETFGGLHVLYNNAGVMPNDDGSVTSNAEALWDLVLGINVKGVAFGCKHGIPAMIGSGGGAIVNVASFVAWMGAATSQTAYTASKGAVLAMTREIAVEYARKGIRCNALCPGPIDTPLLAELLSDDAKRQRRYVHIPMGRLGQAEELARAALFLASDDASFMTGASLIVDGGITAAYVTPED